MRSKTAWKIRLLVVVSLAIGLFVYSRQFHPERENIAGQRVELAKRQAVVEPSRIIRARLLEDVRILSAPDMQGRRVGTAGGAKARDYIVSRFASIGVPTRQQAFTFTPGRGPRFWQAKFWQSQKPLMGVNVIGSITGSVRPDEYLVITAHYDHLGIRDGKIFHGADDNASGVAALLAVASHFKTHPPRHSLLLVAFDGEEGGLRGARALLDKPPVPLAQMRVNVNMDMVSRSAERELYVSGLYANPQLRPIVDGVRARAHTSLLYGHDHPRPIWNGDDWTMQSDHGAFHQRGLPFLYLGVADHPDYHRPTDTFAHIDPDFFTGVVDSTLQLIEALDTAGDGQLQKHSR